MTDHKITLYGFPKSNNAPSPSGFCQKLETFLRAANFTSYTHAETWPDKAPKKKLPYIDLVSPPGPDGTTPTTTSIADSQLIIQSLVASGVCPDLDAPLTPLERADSRAWIAYTEELMYPALVTTRWYWGRDDNYASNLAGLTQVPAVVRPVVGWLWRRKISGAMWTMGAGRHTPEEVDGMVREWMDAVEVRFGVEGGKGWWFGREEPTVVDVVVYAFLANIIGTGEGNREALGMVKERAATRAYIGRATRKWFPEYEGVLRFVTE